MLSKTNKLDPKAVNKLPSIACVTLSVLYCGACWQQDYFTFLNEYPTTILLRPIISTESGYAILVLLRTT